MGVNLGDVPKTKVSIGELAGKWLAIDAYNAIYQFLSSIRQSDGTPLMNSEGKVTAHLAGIFYRNARLLESDITPIYVFDGNPPPFKEATIGERVERKKQAELEWESALEKGDLKSAKKYAQAASFLTKEMVLESKELLSSMGIPFLDAPSEGEAQAAQLVIEGLAYATASQDMDCLLFGSPLLLRNLSVSGKRKIPGKDEYALVEPELISLSGVLGHFGLTREQLIWVGLLVGNDFYSGVDGIGPKKALKIAKNSKSLLEVAENAGVAEDYELMKAVEGFFLNPPVEKGAKIKKGKIDSEKVKAFLCGANDFSYERVDKVCKQIENSQKERKSQTRLVDW